MAYQAIINGARGLVYFGGGIGVTMNDRDRALGWNWTFWERVLRPLLAEELGTRGHLTLASAAPQVEQTLRLVGIERAANIELGDAPGSGVDSIHPG